MVLVDPYKAYQYFKDHFVLGKVSPQKWYPFDCPFCNKAKKMNVNFVRLQTRCWSCGADSDIVTFVSEIENVNLFEAKQILWAIKPSNIRLDLLEDAVTASKTVYHGALPFGFKSLMQGETNLATRARNYLNGRGFNCEELDMEGFGYVNKHNTDNEEEDYFGRIIIPYKRNGKLVYYIGRDYIGSYLRYKNPTNDVFGIGKADIIFNEDALSIHNTVFVLEGALDAKTLGKQATATSGWTFSKYQLNRYFSSKVKNLVFIPDVGWDSKGETFYQKAVKTAMTFLDTHITPYVVNLDVPELAAKGKDVNEIGKKLVIQKFKNDTPPLNWGDAMEIISTDAGKTKLQ